MKVDETATGLLAPAIGRRHSFREFLLQKAIGGVRQVTLADYVPNEKLLNLADAWKLPDGQFSNRFRFSPTHEVAAAAPRLSSTADLPGLNLLFCDS